MESTSPSPSEAAAAVRIAYENLPENEKVNIAKAGATSPRADELFRRWFEATGMSAQGFDKDKIAERKYPMIRQRLDKALLDPANEALLRDLMWEYLSGDDPVVDQTMRWLEENPNETDLSNAPFELSAHPQFELIFAAVRGGWLEGREVAAPVASAPVETTPEPVDEEIEEPQAPVSQPQAEAEPMEEKPEEKAPEAVQPPVSEPLEDGFHPIVTTPGAQPESEEASLPKATEEPKPESTPQTFSFNPLAGAQLKAAQDKEALQQQEAAAPEPPPEPEQPKEEPAPAAEETSPLAPIEPEPEEEAHSPFEPVSKEEPETISASVEETPLASEEPFVPDRIQNVEELLPPLEEPPAAEQPEEVQTMSPLQSAIPSQPQQPEPETTPIEEQPAAQQEPTPIAESEPVEPASSQHLNLGKMTLPFTGAPAEETPAPTQSAPASQPTPEPEPLPSQPAAATFTPAAEPVAQPRPTQPSAGAPMGLSSKVDDLRRHCNAVEEQLQLLRRASREANLLRMQQEAALADEAAKAIWMELENLGHYAPTWKTPEELLQFVQALSSGAHSWARGMMDFLRTHTVVHRLEIARQKWEALRLRAIDELNHFLNHTHAAGSFPGPKVDAAQWWGWATNLGDVEFREVYEFCNREHLPSFVELLTEDPRLAAVPVSPMTGQDRPVSQPSVAPKTTGKPQPANQGTLKEREQSILDRIGVRLPGQ